MSQNISKYVQLNDFVLLEYEFNKGADEPINISSTGTDIAIGTTNLGAKQIFSTNNANSIGLTNNTLELNSVPTGSKRSNWVNNYTDSDIIEDDWFDTIDNNIKNTTTSYLHDSIKVHIISGYNFDDIPGFLLQVRAKDSSGTFVDLSNFTYIKQPDVIGSGKVVKFSSNTLQLGSKFYDKYIEFKVLSTQELGINNPATTLGDDLDITPSSDVFITYSSIPELKNDENTGNNQYLLREELNVQLPVTSVADDFNAFIAESTAGDFIEFYGTWTGNIIGEHMGDIESGRIPLYTSNNPNDNYAEFESTYGDAAKWVLMHEIYVKEHIGGSTVMTQQYVFTQDSNFNSPNYFRPILKNADIATSYSIEYVCRLSNRMDGSQIIRKSSFVSVDPKKYGMKFTRINVENIIPYKIFNKIEIETANISNGKVPAKTKYVKTFYDTTNIVFNENGQTYTQGTGPLYLKNGDSVYKLKFSNYNTITDRQENVDLSGTFEYLLSFKLDDGQLIEVLPTYTNNMNTTIGDIDFKLNADQITKLLKQKRNNFIIKVKNPDRSESIFYEGLYYAFS